MTVYKFVFSIARLAQMMPSGPNRSRPEEFSMSVCKTKNRWALQLWNNWNFWKETRIATENKLKKRKWCPDIQVTQLTTFSSEALWFRWFFLNLFFALTLEQKLGDTVRVRCGGSELTHFSIRSNLVHREQFLKEPSTVYCHSVLKFTVQLNIKRSTV